MLNMRAGCSKLIIKKANINKTSPTYEQAIGKRKAFQTLRENLRSEGQRILFTNHLKLPIQSNVQHVAKFILGY